MRVPMGEYALAQYIIIRGVVGRGRGGNGVLHFFDTGDASPTPPTFWTEIRAKVSPL